VLISIAPNGAVITIAITAVVRMIVPYLIYSTLSESETPSIDIAVSKTIPPIAA
jgi:hypothetical protein